MTLALSKQYTFTSGTTILSAQVNANYDDLFNAFGGLEGMTESFTNLLIDTTLRSSGTIQSADGAVGAPGICFTNGLTDGLYRIGANNFGFSTNGVKRFDISTTALTSTLPLAMGSNKITGLAAATANGDALRYEQLIYIQAPIWAGTNTTANITSSTFTTTGFSASITPRSTSSRVKISYSGGIEIANVATAEAYVTIKRGATELSGAATGFAMARNQNAATMRCPISIVHIDSPASASSVTYTIFARNNDNSTNIRSPVTGNAESGILILEEIV